MRYPRIIPPELRLSYRLQSIRPRQSTKLKDKRQITLTQQTRAHCKIDRTNTSAKVGRGDQVKDSVDSDESEQVLGSEQDEGADGRKDEDADGEQSENTKSEDEETGGQ